MLKELLSWPVTASLSNVVFTFVFIGQLKIIFAVDIMSLENIFLITHATSHNTNQPFLVPTLMYMNKKCVSLCVVETEFPHLQCLCP